MWDLVLNAFGAALPSIGKIAGIDDTKWGDLLGIGTGVFQGLAKPFGFGDGGGSSLQGPQAQAGMDALGKIQGIAGFNATGSEGLAANREAAEAARRFIGQQTADARRAQMQQQAIGSQALGAPQATTDLARTVSMMNLGNQRRDLMQQASAAGGSPAALAGVAGSLGQANTQTLTNLAKEGADAQQRAFQTAGQAYSESEKIRGQDLSQQLANFQPYALQKFGGTTAGALGQLGQYQQTMAQTQAMEDPSALVKQLGGKGANLAFNSPYEQQTAFLQRQAALGQGPAWGWPNNQTRDWGFYGPGIGYRSGK